MRYTCFSFKSIYILLFSLVYVTTYSQKKIIEVGEEWKYYDEREAPPEGWQNSKKITASWKTGRSSLGYGALSPETTINKSKNRKNRVISYYFTKTVIIEDPKEFVLYQLKIKKDDGIVLYLNGEEIFREDMPLGKINHSTKASRVIMSDIEENMEYLVLVFPEDLKIGENIISSSVHQGMKKSGDLLFSLELVGYKDVRGVDFTRKEGSIKNLNTELKLKSLQHTQIIANENQELESLKQKSYGYLIGLTILMVLLFTFLIGMYQVWKRLLKKNKKLITINNSLRDYNQTKGSEMMNISLNSVNNKQFLKAVKKDLETSLKEDSHVAIKKDINRIINDINYNVNSAEDWENLKTHFNVVHSGYVNKLIELHPSLTDIEVRHCIFIKLHMQTKEIANVLHIDPRSVQSSRYRIKKKIGLAEDISLKEYLIRIS